MEELANNYRQLLAVFLVFFVIAGVTYHVPPVLFPALMHDFGVTQYHVSWLGAAFQLVKGTATLPGGFAVDRYGAVACLRWGSLGLLLTSLCYPFAPTLWLLGALQGVNGLLYCLCGLGPIIVFATSWFERQRALAIGILITAFSLSGVVLPPIVAVLVTRVGWRWASALCPLLLIVLALPLTFAVLCDGPLLWRDWLNPVAQGSPDGTLQSVPDTPASPSPTGFDNAWAASGRELTELPPASDPSGSATAMPQSFAHSLRFAAVWHIAFLSMYPLYVITALMNTLVVFLNTDAGLPLELCGSYSSTVFLGSVVGKLLVFGPPTSTHPTCHCIS